MAHRCAATRRGYHCYNSQYRHRRFYGPNLAQSLAVRDTHMECRRQCIPGLVVSSEEDRKEVSEHTLHLSDHNPLIIKII